MRFFSKFTVICNICFVIAVVMWWLEQRKTYKAADGQLIELPWLKGSLVVMGYGAIIVNALFLLLCFIFTAFRVQMKVATWIIIFCILAFAGQLYFFFLS
ncbi:MAG TPA: hypothetical protein VKH37_04470 [Ferruginibacter sp.]|nr:hypothetical protein [Ferruginibacter sp.]